MLCNVSGICGEVVELEVVSIDTLGCIVDDVLVLVVVDDVDVVVVVVGASVVVVVVVVGASVVVVVVAVVS